MIYHSLVTPALMGVIFVFLSWMGGDWFGVPLQSVLLYLVVGLVATTTKIGFAYRAKALTPEKKRERRWQITATFGLSILIAVIFIPAVQLRLELKTLEAAAAGCGLIFAGEVGIFLVLKKLFGIDLTEQTQIPDK
jgi:uncharacterized membrane protein YkvI